MSMADSNEVQPNGGVHVKNWNGKRSTVVEDTNEFAVNFYAYVKSLSYGVEGNANWQLYLKRGDIFVDKQDLSRKFQLKVIKGNFQYKVDTSSKGHLIIKSKEARCPWRISAYP